MEILNHYIDQLLKKSSPQAPVWNIEKINACLVIIVKMKAITYGEYA